MSANTILTTLRQSLPGLAEKYRVKSLEIFGSHAHGTPTKDSDVDILVTFSGPVDIFTFMELEEHLSLRLGHKVDLVVRDSLRPRIRESILSEALPV